MDLGNDMWISIVRLLLCLLLLLLHAALGAVWVQRPQNVTVPLGSDATLTCQLSGDPGYVTWNKNGQTIAVGTTIISADGARLSIPESSKFNLVITNVQKSDDDDYTCTVQNVAGDKSVTVRLNVLLPPGQPVLEINDSRPVKVENDVIALTCSSAGGNPAPMFTWTKNGKVLNSNIVETKVPKGLSSSLLTVHLDFTDHLATYSCSVQNSVNSDKPYSVSTVFQVLYYPIITFSPYKDLSIILGDSGSILCNVSSNPAVTSVSWTKDGISSPTTNAMITFSPASRTNSGSYSCSATNTINGQSKTTTNTATVNVIYAPIIDVPFMYEIDESSNLDITCKVDANPLPFYTKWQNSVMESVDASLRIDNIKRSHKGNYSCVSRNTLKPSGKDESNQERTRYTYIYVRYPPGSSSISPVLPVYVGDSLTLMCSVSDPGYPSPTYEWRKVEGDQILATTTAQLTINGVALQDNGNFSCTPKNSKGNGGTSIVQVKVNEKPSFVDPPKVKDTIYNNRTGYSIICKVRGRPKPVIQWYKNGKQLDTSGKLYTLTTTEVPADTYSFLVTSQVYLTGSDRVGTNTLQITDIANYTCREASSDLQNTMELYIYFPPKESENEKVATTVSSSARLACIGEGYPLPLFTWKRNNAEISSGGRLTIYPSKTISVTSSESVLQIDRIVSQDFGDYTCEMSNQFGKTTKNLTLMVTSKPEPPTSLSCPGKLWDRLRLRWVPGFNGGSSQTFKIMYRSNPPTTGYQTAGVTPENVTEYTVTNLFPNTAYEFQVYGSNDLGDGDLSQPITMTTDALTFPVIKETPEYSADNKELVLNLSINNTYCLKVKVSTNGGQSWLTYTNNDLECFDANVGMMIIPTEGINRMNVSLCLITRTEVCGDPVSVKISQSSTPDLTETEVIIIGCVCAAILIALLTVLVCIIVRRRMQAKQMPPQTPNILAANGHANPPQKPPRGFENTDSELNRNGYPPFPRPNGNVPLDTSYDPEFENEMNRRNANKSNSNYYNEKQGDISFTGTPRTPTKDRQYIDMPAEDRKGDFNNGPESGYNTQDNPKPKKVIYEVVV